MHCTIPKDIKFSIDQRHYPEDHHEHINFRDDNFLKVTIHHNCFFYSYKTEFVRMEKIDVFYDKISVTFGYVYPVCSSSLPVSPSFFLPHLLLLRDSILLSLSPSFLSAFFHCKSDANWGYSRFLVKSRERTSRPPPGIHPLLVLPWNSSLFYLKSNIDARPNFVSSPSQDTHLRTLSNSFLLLTL